MKVVIPAAGRGTRFLPATKAMPKEMLPVVDKPVIQYVVEEAVAAGADDILIVTGKSKRAIEDHFEDFTAAQIHYVRQREPLGLAHAIGLARAHTRDEPFGVLLGDTIHVCKVPLLRQLWEAYEALDAPVIAVELVPESRVKDYGIVEGVQQENGFWACTALLEKPMPAQTPSRLGITGAYVLTPEIYDTISLLLPGVGGELQLTDALSLLVLRRAVYAVRFEGKRYDIGNPASWLRANLEFAWRREDLREELKGVWEKWSLL